MSALRDITTVMLVAAGVVFFLAGTVGRLRFPNTLTRLHVLTKADNLGLGLIVVGLLPQTEGILAGLKLVAGGCSHSWPERPRPGWSRALSDARAEAMSVGLALDTGLALLASTIAIWIVVARQAASGAETTGCPSARPRIGRAVTRLANLPMTAMTRLSERAKNRSQYQDSNESDDATDNHGHHHV